MPKSTYENEQNFEGEISSGINRAGETMREAAGSVTKAAENVRHGVGDAASYMRQKADTMTTTVGEALENTGHYLRDDGIRHLSTDLTNLVRRNPVPALLAGLGAGYLLGCATTNRRSHSNMGRGEFHA